GTMIDPTPPDGPHPLDEAIAAFREMPVPPCPADDAWVARLAAGNGPAAGLPSRSRRRLMMRVATLSAAAALAAVCATAFLAGPASTALADVVKAAEKHTLVKYTMTQYVDTKDGSSVLPAVDVAYADLRAPRFRTENRGPSLSGAIDFE